jgi:hypothetical protein
MFARCRGGLGRLFWGRDVSLVLLGRERRGHRRRFVQDEPRPPCIFASLQRRTRLALPFLDSGDDKATMIDKEGGVHTDQGFCLQDLCICGRHFADLEE